ncbi:MAG: FTR1 family iron permease [Nitrosopumilus sp.]|uniref:FTR1 family iron permease n=1 Tax=Nitrosopumilus sp. TaxID=2024843 RepID=UPI00242E35F9|nr:FTR1 family protein [Nitrosopumilus sp.]MCV0366595.1 FTR1 family iron permease [Nitrosopumilus sp.]
MVVFLFSTLLVPDFSVHGQSNNPDTTLFFIKSVTLLSLDMLADYVEQGDVESAKNISMTITSYFPLHLQTLRQHDPETSDEIHLLLLDIHSSIGKSDNQKILSEINTVQTLLERYKYDSPDFGKTIAQILTLVDEQYQFSVQNDVPSSYQLSVELVDLSIELFGNTNYDERLTLEISSFLDELKIKIENKDDFHSVGTLISVINRDFVGTETVVYDKQKFYENIRSLYEKLFAALDQGDYAKAEELGIEAYLENFEYLEADIEKVDPKLLYDLEIDMREKLREMIQNKQDVKGIKTFVSDSILPDLANAEEQVKSLGNAGLSDIVLEKELKDMGDASEGAKESVRNEIDFIRDTLQALLVQYDEGDFQSAYTSARTAYLDSYEFVEIPLRAIDPDFTLEVEFQFAELRNMIQNQAPSEDIQEVVIAIKRNLDESERLVSGVGTLAPMIAFTSSFAIIFREGLESVLILGAVLSYLEASRNNQFKKYVYYGVLVAFGATAITWVIASYVIEISGANRELIEAIAALSATAVLFYVSFWVLNKIEHKKWMEFVKAKVWQASATGSVMVFVMLAFFTVYREGFETVLFYQAMSGFAKYMELQVGLGFVLGIVSLIAIYYGMRRLGRKLPLRALFGLTMGVGAYLSIAFLGNAVRELQVLDIVPYTGMIGVMPRLDINLATMTGIYPTLETVVSQIILLGVYLAASSYVLVVRPKREKQIAMMRKSRSTVDD